MDYYSAMKKNELLICETWMLINMIISGGKDNVIK